MDMSERKNWVNRFLDFIERICNKLPPPAILFCWLFVIVAVLGTIFHFTGYSVVNPATLDTVSAQNFFSSEGITWLLDNLVKNFTTFAPLGITITMTLAIGMSEESGLIITLLRKCMRNVPAGLVAYVVAFVGVMGNVAADSAMVVVPPIAAVIYIGVGKHPIAGMICGYAAAQAGFGANLMISANETLLTGLTNEAIQSFLPGTSFSIDVTCNWFFMAISTFLCAFVVGFICNHLVDKRFGPWKGTSEEKVEEITPIQSKGMHTAGLAVLVYFLVLALGYFFGPLALVREDGTRGFVGSPLLNGMVPVLAGLFMVSGIAYGISSKKFKTVIDVNDAMVKQMSLMGSYIVFCFFCGQFQKLFSWTNLDSMFAITGANFLKDIGFTGLPLLVSFILLSAIVNIFIVSGSSKWAIFAPIFIPMFMMLGYNPAMTQLAYRLGDSPTNTFTPMVAYIWMVLEVGRNKYDKNLTLGTLASSLLPIGVVMQVVWIVFFIIWYMLGLPIGPGVEYMMPAGIL